MATGEDQVPAAQPVTAAQPVPAGQQAPAEQQAKRRTVPGEMDQVLSAIYSELDTAEIQLVQRLHRLASPKQLSDETRNAAYEEWRRINDRKGHTAIEAFTQTAAALLPAELPSGLSYWTYYRSQLELELVDRNKLRADTRPWWARLFTPSPRERAEQWRALAARAWASHQNSELLAEEVPQLRREYENLKAWQVGMALKIGLYQACVLALIISAVFLVPRTLRRESMELIPIVSALLIGAFWGAVGACGSSLWSMLFYSARRGLRTDMMSAHLLKPVLGAILGTVVVLLAPENVNGAGATGETIWLLALLAGFFERSFIDALHGIMDRLLNKASENVTARWDKVSTPKGNQ